MNYADRVRRGEIYYVYKNLGDGVELGGSRPAVIISADFLNSTSTTVEVVYMTTQPKKEMPTHVEIKATGKTSTVLCEQVDTIDTDRIGSYMATLTDDELDRVMQGIMVGLGMDAFGNDEKYQAQIAMLNSQIEALSKRHEEDERFYRSMIEKICN